MDISFLKNMKIGDSIVVAVPSDHGQSQNNRGRNLYDAKGNQAEEKDLWRIRDMKARAKGDEFKLIQLANQMASSITKKDKAYRRADASRQILDGKIRDRIVEIFEKRAQHLN